MVATLAQPVWAQSAPQDSDSSQAEREIVVTGSRIARKDFVSQTPVVTANKAAIEAAGTATVDAYLLQLPQFQPGAGGFTSSNNGGSIGLSTLNLRGLGPQRNLVLVDGRRFQPSTAETVVDINSIPAAAIGDVEIISGGASATYGSDAVAGVINFKLRRNFTGLEIGGQFGISDQGDAGSKQLSAIAGTTFSDGRGSIMIAGEWNKRDAVSYQDREGFRQTANISNILPEGALVANSNNLPSQAVVNSIFGSYGIAAGAVPRTAVFGFNTDGTLFRSASPGENFRGSRSGPFVQTATAFGSNGAYFSLLQVPLERSSVLGRAEYQVSDALTLYAQGVYNHSKVYGRGSQPLLTGAGGQLTISVNNPFIPADLGRLLASRPNPGASFNVTSRIGLDGPRTYSQTSDLTQFLVGARGDIGDSGWTYDIYTSRGRTKIVEQTIGGSVSISALRQLAAAADGGASLCAGGYNPFGVNPVSASCLTFIQRRPRNEITIEQDVVEGTVSGGLFNLPAGEVKVALNSNYRRNFYGNSPDAGFAAGDIAPGLVTPATSGTVKMFDIGGEILLPLIHSTPLIQALNVTLGYRYSHYDPSGPVSTYKADFDWKIIDSIVLRGGYQRAVRAPNVGEFYLGVTRALTQIGSFPSGGDPCDVRSTLRTGANASSVRSLCIAQGIGTNLVDTYQYFGVVGLGTTTGNVDLKPEKADTFTLGLVFQPKNMGELFRRFNVSVDYYNIRIKDAISSIDAATSLQKCFNADGSNPSYSVTNIYCANIKRDSSTGGFEELLQPLLNLGGFKTSGIDFQVDWTIPLADRVNVSLNSVVNYLDKFEVQNFPNARFQDFTNTISSLQSYPRWKTLMSATVNFGDVRVGARWRHISAMRDRSTVVSPTSTIPGTPAYNYLDLNAAFSVGSEFEFRLGVNNVTDKAPPIVGGALGSTNAGVYDVIGRSFYAGFRAKF
ncbi:TonB-dependent receptor domain-containing protein [Sphingobium sp. B8D3B]|uniref:TonB-dependent receptor domain-containing protein n=1 Tax=Sphingobium sp. B8D3B TaxID=2940585 RepID=UPI002224227A|nr:TonB-dependent receptor [Sphingobium sp. B8D3B]MCW2419261.1 outer membrane receptor protein involved in Fe transport [Sphingobium sp. B8D3C]